MNQRDQFKSIARSVYLVAFVLVAGPLLDLAAVIWPLHPTAVAWRFGAVGVLSKALLVPILGSLAAMIAAIILEHRLFQRVIAYLNGGIAILLIGTTILFLLDGIQLRPGIAVEVQGAYDVAAARALVNLVLAGVVLGALSLSGFKASKRAESVSEPTVPPLVSRSSHSNPAPSAF